MLYCSVMENSDKIIDALGGAAVVAKILGLPKPTVQAWKAKGRGIPPKIQLAYPKLIRKGKRLAEKKFPTS